MGEQRLGETRLLSLKELAEHFGVSEKTVKRMPIPYTRIGRQRRYHPAIVKRYEVMNASPGGMLDWKEAS
jgi:AraC-like DNA-binding protein